MSSFRIFDIAGSGMSAQSVRLNTTASNLANADSVSGDPDQGLPGTPSAVCSDQGGLGLRTRVQPRCKVLGITENQAPRRPFVMNRAIRWPMQKATSTRPTSTWSRRWWT